MGDNGRYPHQEFKIGASDLKGHFERVQVKMPPEMMGKIQKVVNSKVWPYESYQEFIRHAILAHFRWLEKDRPEVSNLSHEIEAVNMLLREEEDRQNIERTYDKMRLVLRKNMDMNGDNGKARNVKLITDIWKEINSIDDPYWRKMWMDRFRRDYDMVLNSAPKVDLGRLARGEGELPED